MSVISCIDSEEVRHAGLLRLYNSLPPAWVLVMEFAKCNTRAGLSCVFTEHWWLLASLFSLFFFLNKIAYFSLQMGVWGSSEVFFFFFFPCCTHTHHLWIPGISDKFPDCPWCRLVSTQSDQDPSLGLSLFISRVTTVISSTKCWCCGMSVFLFWINSAKVVQRAYSVLCCSPGTNVGMLLWTEIHALLSTYWCLSSVHFLFRALLGDVMLLLASSLLP